MTAPSVCSCLSRACQLQQIGPAYSLSHMNTPWARWLPGGRCLDSALSPGSPVQSPGPQCLDILLLVSPSSWRRQQTARRRESKWFSGSWAFLWALQGRAVSPLSHCQSRGVGTAQAARTGCWGMGARTGRASRASARPVQRATELLRAEQCQSHPPVQKLRLALDSCCLSHRGSWPLNSPISLRPALYPSACLGFGCHFYHWAVWGKNDPGWPGETPRETHPPCRKEQTPCVAQPA